MLKTIDATLGPSDFASLKARDLSRTVCVVFDILRATSTMVTALESGAKEIFPVETIEQAVAMRKKKPDLLLAGERHGYRIGGDLAGGVEFDFGNSPREFLHPSLSGRSMATTTTNGTRALRACAHARQVLIASFLNLSATAGYLKKKQPSRLLLVCSGTYEEPALEDMLGAGALAALLGKKYAVGSDAVAACLLLYQRHARNLLRGLKESKNGARLAALPDLKADLKFCSQVDRFRVVAGMKRSGAIRKL